MSVIKTEAYYNSTNGISKVHTLIWKDDEKEPAAALQISHGAAEHIGRYDRFARYMAENGFVVFGNDHLGHGKTASSMEELGNFGAIGDDVRMVDDMNVLHKIMSKKYPDIPYFLFGHSMGSLLARIYAEDFPDGIRGLILSGTTNVNDTVTLLRSNIDTVGEIAGRDKFSDTASEIFDKLSAKYYSEDDDYTWLSLSKKNREDALNDPYFGFPLSSGSVLNITKMAMKCSSNTWFANFPTEIPVLLVSGAKDPMGLFGRSVIKVADKLEASDVCVDIKLYPGLRHEILNEDDYENIYNDILSWTYNQLQGNID